MLSPPSTCGVFPGIQYVAEWQMATIQRAMSSGVVDVSGVLARTIGDIALASTGSVEVRGVLNVTIGPITSSRLS